RLSYDLPVAVIVLVEHKIDCRAADPSGSISGARQFVGCGVNQLRRLSRKRQAFCVVGPGTVPVVRIRREVRGRQDITAPECLIASEHVVPLVIIELFVKGAADLAAESRAYARMGFGHAAGLVVNKRTIKRAVYILQVLDMAISKVAYRTTH